MTLRILVPCFALVVSLMSPGPALGQDLEPESVFANRVVSLSLGDPAPEQSETSARVDRVLGAPDGNPGGSVSRVALSLGCGGTLVVAFANQGIADGEGPDLRIYETGGKVEAYSVDVSSDLAEWYALGTSEGGVGDFDLSSVDAPKRAYRFVRITDLKGHCEGRLPGADVDAVAALNTREIGGTISVSARDKSDAVDLLSPSEGTSIKIVDIDGNELDAIEDATPFRVVVSIADPPEDGAKVLVRWLGAAQRVAVARDETDANAFLSDVLYLRKDMSSLSADPDKAQATLARHFSGTWRVSHSTQEGETIVGLADVADEGDIIVMTLEGPDGEEEYVSMQTDAHHAPDDPDPFRTTMEASFERTDIAGGTAEHAALIHVPEDLRTLNFSYRDAEREVPIVWRNSKSIRVWLQTRDDDDRYDGTWSERLSGALSRHGEATWIRGEPRIDHVIVAEDQSQLKYPFAYRDGKVVKVENALATRTLIALGKRLLPEADFAQVVSHSEAITYTYRPLSQSTKDRLTWRARTTIARTLSHLKSTLARSRKIYKALPTGAGSQRRRAVLTEHIQKLENEIEETEARLELLKGHATAVFLTAHIDVGAMPGTTAFSLKNEFAEWELSFADQQATLHFARHGDLMRDESATVFYPGDIAVVDLEFQTDFPTQSSQASRAIGIQITRTPADGGPVENYATINAVRDRLAEFNRPAFRTVPFHIADADDASNGPPLAKDILRIKVRKGDVIAARLADPSQASIQPPTVIAEIRDHPAELGSLWRNALGRVAVCDGDTFTSDTNAVEYARQESLQIEKFVAADAMIKFMRRATLAGYLTTTIMDYDTDSPTEFHPSIELLKGDHAAAILIAEEMIALLPTVEPGFRALADNKNGEIQALRAWGRQAADPGTNFFLKNNKAAWNRAADNPWLELAIDAQLGLFSDTVKIVEIPFIETLDYEALGRRLSLAPADAENWAIEQFQEAAQRQLDAIEFAKGRAIKALDCNLEELIVVAGQKSDPAVAQILPRLVKRVIDQGPPRHRYWQPDQHARGFVERLHAVGEGVRALEAYERLDDGYKAMALAAAVAGGAAIAAGKGALLASGITLAGDSADIAYFGLKDLDRYLNAESYYDFARGVAPLIGEHVLDEAEAVREGAFWTAVSLIAPGVGALSSVKDLRNFANVRKGKALFELEGSRAVHDLSKLSDGQREQMAGYYIDLLARSGWNRLDALDDVDRKALAEFNKFFEDNGLSTAALGNASQSTSATAKLETDNGTGAVGPSTTTVPPPTEGRRTAGVEPEAPAPRDQQPRQAPETERFTDPPRTESGDTTIFDPPLEVPSTTTVLPPTEGRRTAGVEPEAPAPRDQQPRQAPETERFTDPPRPEPGDTKIFDPPLEVPGTTKVPPPTEGRRTAGVEPEAPAPRDQPPRQAPEPDTLTDVPRVDRGDATVQPPIEGRRTAGVDPEAPAPRDQPPRQAPEPDTLTDVPRAHPSGTTLLEPPLEVPGTTTFSSRQGDQSVTDAYTRAPSLRDRSLPQSASIPKSSDDSAAASDSPFKHSVAPSWAREGGPVRGTLQGDLVPQPRQPGKTIFKEGSVIELSDGTRIRIGKHIASGAANQVYRAPGHDGAVVKLSRLKAGDVSNSPAFDDAVGHELVKAAEQGNGYFRTVRRKKAPVVIRDRYGNRWLVWLEESVEKPVKGRITKNAAERFAIEGPTDAQFLTMVLAIRELNRKGIAWTDHKRVNFDIVRDDDSPTGYRMVIFDTGGMFSMRGATQPERANNARRVQIASDSMEKAETKEIADEQYFEFLDDTDLASVFDDKPYKMTEDSRPWPLQMSPGANIERQEYQISNNLSPEAFEDRLTIEWGDKRASELLAPLPPRP